MESYIAPPQKIPFFMRLMLRAVEKGLGKPLYANRILAWYPKAFFGSGLMEALVAHNDKEVSRRLLNLIRMYTSFLVSCPFCIDMNSQEFRQNGITNEELAALQGQPPIAAVATFTAAEQAALHYTACLAATPVAFNQEVIAAVKQHFSPRAIVIIASTAAQVNFWARLISSLGVPPAGFSSECALLNLDKYRAQKI